MLTKLTSGLLMGALALSVTAPVHAEAANAKLPLLAMVSAQPDGQENVPPPEAGNPPPAPGTNVPPPARPRVRNINGFLAASGLVGLAVGVGVLSDDEPASP
ncbi:hypothetical protein SLG_21450 [Sphingobium sp. SYK-6]|uniref:hypothetical protein n=1 Tax=Sphingobium sp. (strain NBRC 103272 / SYK-6) TaxID=627192 RepID=UPI0002276F02|nr:hypothetical protein [Sphingobium sp. SYK-6]BAK66820.1 hypothetical protein SLG_21450 [Sphingobium sp. SYK-6]